MLVLLVLLVLVMVLMVVLVVLLVLAVLLVVVVVHMELRVQVVGRMLVVRLLVEKEKEEDRLLLEVRRDEVGE